MSEDKPENSQGISYLTDEYLSRMDTLNEALKSGDEGKIHGLIGELTTLRESALYLELGKITREIHESINAFGNDQKVAKLAIESIPDAKERLNYIVTKTDQAAHKTMEVAEATMVLSDGFSDRARSLRKRWEKFRNRELSKEDFINLNDEIDQFFNSVDDDSREINRKMNDIMLAQDYQDITGQMIKQVVTMVQEVEEKLVRLVTISGAWCSVSDAKIDGEVAEGPQLPTADKDKVATSQGDVDDILASLGF
ncbi:MAG: protein phosphatase CheZ [Gammaproteobacteria bacterium]|nr:protein phosphatase CheZ [Gammaproteobacteria bacterium]